MFIVGGATLSMVPIPNRFGIFNKMNYLIGSLNKV